MAFAPTHSELKYGLYNYAKSDNAEKVEQLFKYFEQNPRKKNLFLLKEKLFFHALKYGDTIFINRMLDCFGRRCFYKGQDENGRTALMWSLYWYNIPLFDRIITEFKDFCFPGELDNEGNGSLEYAMQRNLSFQVSELLRVFEFDMCNHAFLSLDKYVMEQQKTLSRIQKYKIKIAERILEDDENC